MLKSEVCLEETKIQGERKLRITQIILALGKKNIYKYIWDNTLIGFSFTRFDIFMSSTWIRSVCLQARPCIDVLLEGCTELLGEIVYRYNPSTVGKGMILFVTLAYVDNLIFFAQSQYNKSL